MGASTATARAPANAVVTSRLICRPRTSRSGRTRRTARTGSGPGTDRRRPLPPPVGRDSAYVTVKQPAQLPTPLSPFTTFTVLAPVVVLAEMVMLAVSFPELTKVV